MMIFHKQATNLNRNTFLFLVIILGAIPSYGQSWRTELRNGNSEVTFDAVGTPSLIKVHGKSEKGLQGHLELTGNQLKGIGVFLLDKLDTGISMRTEHMKNKYLEVNKYPIAKLTLKPIPLASNSSEQDTEFSGTLQLHGVEGPVRGKLHCSWSKNELRIKLKFPVSLREFKIPPPQFARITIKDEIAVAVDGNFPLSGIQ